MTGRTGYTPTPAEFDPQTHIDDVYEHFDPLIGESVPTATALPASGNWDGRTVYVIDAKSHYVYDSTGWRILLQTKWLAVPGTAFGDLPLTTTGWTNLAAPTQIPVNPFGAGVNYVVETHGFTTQTPGAGGGFAIRCMLDGATMQVGGFAQVVPTAQTTLTTTGRSTVTTPGTAHTVSVQIGAVTTSSTVLTGATISGYWVELKRLGAI